jgi:hypothetical protein
VTRIPGTLPSRSHAHAASWASAQFQLATASSIRSFDIFSARFFGPFVSTRGIELLLLWINKNAIFLLLEIIFEILLKFRTKLNWLQ